MFWVRFSSFVQYAITFIMHVLSVILTYDLFFSPNSNEELAMVAIYHQNAANRYWFVFSSLNSMVLLGISVAYYTFSYGVIMYQQSADKSLYDLITAEDIYRLTLVDFGFISISIAWNIIWAIHLLMQLGQSAFNYTNDAYVERAKILLLLSTQITLIALRYPSLFQTLHSQTPEKKRNQNVIQQIGLKIASI